MVTLITELEELEKQYRALFRDESKKLKREKKQLLLNEQKQLASLKEKYEVWTMMIMMMMCRI